MDEKEEATCSDPTFHPLVHNVEATLMGQTLVGSTQATQQHRPGPRLE